MKQMKNLLIDKRKLERCHENASNCLINYLLDKIGIQPAILCLPNRLLWRFKRHITGIKEHPNEKEEKY